MSEIEIDDYQRFTRTTAIYDKNVALGYLFNGLSAEVGEVCGKYAKYLRDGTRYSNLRNDILKELGDVMWFVARLSDEFDISLDEVLSENIKKLNSRKERGVIGGSGDER